MLKACSAELMEADRAAQLWQLGITELCGHNVEAHGREEVNRMLQDSWVILHIYDLHHQDNGVGRQRPMAILGKGKVG